jgi:hypothetical protein
MHGIGILIDIFHRSAAFTPMSQEESEKRYMDGEFVAISP